MQIAWETSSFQRNVKGVQLSFSATKEEILTLGGRIWSASAARWSPPAMGMRRIPKPFYQDGEVVSDPKETPHGHRAIIDLLAAVRSHKSKYNRRFGEELHKGNRYAVKMFRRGRKMQMRFCSTFGEAKQFAHLTYRGLLRAAWGLDLSAAGIQMPAAVRELVNKRPGLSQLTRLTRTDRYPGAILITNAVMQGSDGFFQVVDNQASRAAVKAMREASKRYLNKKKEL